MRITPARLNTVVGLEVRQATGQSIDSGSETLLTWDTTDENIGFTFTPGSGTITIPADGIYDISCSIRWAANATGYRRLSLYASGTLRGDLIVPAVSGVAQPLTVAKTIRLAAGATVDARVIQTSGGALALAQTSRTPNLTIWRVA